MQISTWRREWLLGGVAVIVLVACTKEDPAVAGPGGTDATSDTGGPAGDHGATGKDDNGGTVGGDADAGSTTGDQGSGATGDADVPLKDGSVEDGSTTAAGDADGGSGTTTGDAADGGTGGDGDGGSTGTGDVGPDGSDVPQCGSEELPFCCDKCDTYSTFPVCGKDGVTYPNDCHAYCKFGNVDDYTPGACKKVCDPTCDQYTSPKPVCDPKSNKTYANMKEACCNGLDLGEVMPGECGGGCGLACSGDPSPLCAKLNDGTTKTFTNSCVYAECANKVGDAVVCVGECTNTVKCGACKAQGCKPVCGENGVTYPNACVANCEKAVIQSVGVCCSCPTVETGQEVCSTLGKTYKSDCFLNCNGEIKAYAGKCVDGCAPKEGDKKVCGSKGGQIQVYANLDCAKKDSATCIFEETPDCALPAVSPCLKSNQAFAPVCATLSDGTGGTFEKSYVNDCWAGCDKVDLSKTKPGVCSQCQTICQEAEPKTYCAKNLCALFPNTCVPEKCFGVLPADLTKDNCPVECQ